MKDPSLNMGKLKKPKMVLWATKGQTGVSQYASLSIGAFGAVHTG